MGREHDADKGEQTDEHRGIADPSGDVDAPVQLGETQLGPRGVDIDRQDDLPDCDEQIVHPVGRPRAVVSAASFAEAHPSR
ncbi:hypothetical protein GCM10027265_04570 [Jatrophihabitans fulvus]